MVGRVAFAFLLIIAAVLSDPVYRDIVQGSTDENKLCYRDCLEANPAPYKKVCASLFGKLYDMERAIFNCCKDRCQQLFPAEKIYKISDRACTEQDRQNNANRGAHPQISQRDRMQSQRTLYSSSHNAGYPPSSSYGPHQVPRGAY